MSKSEKKKPPPEESASLAAIHLLGEAILEDIQEKNEEHLEVFERYTHLLRSKIQGEDFCTRLVKGYRILNEILKRTL